MLYLITAAADISHKTIQTTQCEALADPDNIQPALLRKSFQAGRNMWNLTDKMQYSGIPSGRVSKTRNQYHYAIRRTKKMSDSIRAHNLLKASEFRSVNLLKEMKTIKEDFLQPS